MVRKATKDDSRTLAELAVRLWEGHTVEEMEAEFCEALERESAAFFIRYADDLPAGFAQCALRHDYVEGTQTSPVGYLEGIYVMASHRHKGYARELLLACEQWAREVGCAEFASDCELDNHASLNFHLAMGFEEANRIICFRKAL